ncbi:uncharacterized protein BO96DRAFT_15421 [Aspergillus niger CBS 101883]|uniref:uncharacterized protein n=1 Tax=Aspergillus lacticoffeatus (strain CBS 101883) TaxID=1450533 RepID=UPI000D7FBE77|nr:uncharacterized protein BO96DRAFT_15421 [Aspergillus niger CBS 101883]PYH62554.1 hypothetical protein BO96DRAFT_15421 [Aspergillus niger CBS 101883]
MSLSGAARSVTTVAATPATPLKAKRNHVTHAFFASRSFDSYISWNFEKAFCSTPRAIPAESLSALSLRHLILIILFSSHFVRFSILFGFSCDCLKNFPPSLWHTAHCPLGLLVSPDRSRVDGSAPLLCGLVQSDIFLFRPDLNRSTSKPWLPECDLILTHCRDQRRCASTRNRRRGAGSAFSPSPPLISSSPLVSRPPFVLLPLFLMFFPDEKSEKSF